MEALSSGAGQYILPILAGGASLLSPRIGAGVNSALGVMDWARKNRKVAEEEKGLTTLGTHLSGQPQAQKLGLTPELLQNPVIAKLMAGPILENIQKEQEPVVHWGESNDTPYMWRTTKGSTEPPIGTPIGPQKSPNFSPNQDADAIAVHGKRFGELNQDEVNQVVSWRDQRDLDKFNRMTQRQEESQARSHAFAIDRQAGHAKQAQIDSDVKQARTRLGQINSGFRQSEQNLNKWYEAQKSKIAENLTLTKAKRATEESALQTEADKYRANMMDDYLAQVDDFKTEFGHVSPQLKGFGITGTPKVVESRRKRLGEGGGGGEVGVLGGADLADYQRVMKSGNAQDIAEAQRLLRASGKRLP
jgi:hypothetical protein